MNLDLILALIFYSLLLIFFLRNKEKFEIQSKIFALYKTKLGLNLMNKISNLCPNLLRLIGFFSIFIGFLGMLSIFYILLKGTYNLILLPESQPILSPVLPGIKIPGLPRLSFWHWIISILIIAITHEFSHGIFARLYKIPIKSSGFAFLGPILAAFVEPDEKILQKKSSLKQLSVFSAGPFSNILSAILILLLLIFLINPYILNFYNLKGVEIINIEKNFPAYKAGLSKNEIITQINNLSINNITDFINIMKKLKPNEKITLKTDKQIYNITTTTHPKNTLRPYIGVIVTNKLELKQKTTLISTAVWLRQLLIWLYIINLGVGLFNLLPLGPVDGGRMFNIALLSIFKNKTKANKIWLFITSLCLILIFINLLPYLLKLLLYINNIF